MRRRVSLIAVFVLLLSSVVAGCSEAGEDGGIVTDAETMSLRVSGSSTCMPLLELLTGAYPNHEVRFIYLPGLHSGGGVAGVFQGDLEIGAISRMLTPSEVAEGLEEVWLSSDGLAIAAHPTAGVDGLTTQQVIDIYAGRYENWAEVGGSDLPIIVLDRNEDESAKIILREYVLGSVEVTSSAVFLYYETDMVEALSSTPGAIGYFSYGYGVSRNLAVQYLTLDGVKPFVGSIMDGSYGVVRPLGIVISPDADTAILEFAEWVQGPVAREIMIDNGFAPYER